MTLSSISPITLEGQPQELSSFTRAGVLYVLWHTPISDIGLKRLHWKPHTGLDFTEVTPALGVNFTNVTAVLQPSTDQLVVIWDDGTAVAGSVDGNIVSARFNVLTGVLISGPTVLFPGSQAKVSYRTVPGNQLALYYVTVKSGGVYGRLSLDGGVTWQSGEPLITNQVLGTTKVEVVPYDSEHVSIAQLGSDPRNLSEIGMFQRTRPLSSIVKITPGEVGHPLDGDTLALWRLDEAGTTWADATGNFPLTQTGAPASVVGRVGNARKFTTSGQYALGASTQAARDAINDGEFTVEFWFFCSTADFAGAPSTGILFGLQGDTVSGIAQNALYQVQIASPSRQITQTSQSGANVSQFGVSGMFAPLDTWSHFAWRSKSDGAGTFNWDVFMNGVFFGQRTLRVAPGGGSAAQFQIAAGLNFGVAPHATLDDIRISKVARTDAEILTDATGRPFDLIVGEPSKFDNTTLIDNLRGGLVLATDNSKLYHLDGVQQGVSDTYGAVTRLSVVGTVVAEVATAGPTGNGDDLNTYTLIPFASTPNVDLPGASFAVGLAVSSTHGYVAEYADNSAVLGQLIVVDLSSGSTATVFTGVTAVRAVATANFLSPVRILVATTESGVERLRVYHQLALTPPLIANTKLPARVNALTAIPHPTDATGLRLLVSMVDRFNIYDYISASVPLVLVDSYRFSGGGQFFKSVVAANGNIVVAAGNAGVLVLNPTGKVKAQIQVSGKPVAEWKPNTVYTLGALVKPRARHPFVRNRLYFKVTNVGAGTGTSGTDEPSWLSAGIVYDPILPPTAGNTNSLQWTSQGVMDGVVTDVALDEPAKRIFAVGVVGGDLGTDGRVWILGAGGLL